MKAEYLDGIENELKKMKKKIYTVSSVPEDYLTSKYYINHALYKMTETRNNFLKYVFLRTGNPSSSLYGILNEDELDFLHNIINKCDTSDDSYYDNTEKKKINNIIDKLGRANIKDDINKCDYANKFLNKNL